MIYSKTVPKSAEVLQLDHGLFSEIELGYYMLNAHYMMCLSSVSGISWHIWIT